MAVNQSHRLGGSRASYRTGGARSRREDEYVQQPTISAPSHTDTTVELTPFWSGADSFWTSSDGPVRAFTALNYTYPEFAGLNLNNPGEVKTAILRIVKDLYGPPQKKGPFAGKEREHWYIRVRAGRFALGTSYTILLFIGAVPDQQSEWREAPTLVGFHSIFSSRHQQQCGNCVAQNDAVNEGVVHIDDKLEELGLTGKSDDEIEAYLKEELHWRIQKVSSWRVAVSDCLLISPFRWTGPSCSQKMSLIWTLQRCRSVCTGQRFTRSTRSLITASLDTTRTLRTGALEGIPLPECNIITLLPPFEGRFRSNLEHVFVYCRRQPCTMNPFRPGILRLASLDQPVNKVFHSNT